jgi:anthranilate/para-aminobenzoate synthase component II
MIVVVDNRDSFVFNLARHFHLLGVEAVVVSSHAATAAEILQAAPAAIVISPGPCTPAEAGCSMELVQKGSEIFSPSGGKLRRIVFCIFMRTQIINRPARFTNH